MYNIFRRTVPDYSNLVIEKVKFNLIIINVSVGKVYCCYLDQRDLNGPQDLIYIYERQHRGNSGACRYLTNRFKMKTPLSLRGEGEGFEKASRRLLGLFSKPSAPATCS